MEDVWKSRATLCIIGGGGVEDGMGEATFLFFLSQPQLNHKSTQPNIYLSWVRHENDFANQPPPHTQKLNVSNISAVTDPILTKL